MSDPGFRPHPGHGAGPSGASLSDILTAVQHVASNISLIAQRYMNALGTGIGEALTAPTVLKQGVGRIGNVSVTAESGSAVGLIIDATLPTATGPVIYVIPATVGLYQVNLPFKFGLLVVPGSGMTVSVSYS